VIRFDPSGSEGLITPFIFYFMIHDALVMPRCGRRRVHRLAVVGRNSLPQARRIAELAARSRLPAMYELRPYVEAGGLASYGTDIRHVWRRAAVFADKILKGAKPADLPVEQPLKFELVVNLQTAKALGLTIPQIRAGAGRANHTVVIDHEGH
jgi:hypothetical protein